MLRFFTSFYVKNSTLSPLTRVDLAMDSGIDTKMKQ